MQGGVRMTLTSRADHARGDRGGVGHELIDEPVRKPDVERARLPRQGKASEIAFGARVVVRAAGNFQAPDAARSQRQRDRVVPRRRR